MTFSNNAAVRHVLKITISEEFAKASVPVTLGLICCHLPTMPDANKIKDLFLENVREAEACMADIKPADLNEIAAARRAFKAMGKDPSRYRPSSEALYRRIATGKGLWQVNPIVDANNVLSLQTRWPVGAYDMTKISGEITFRTGKSDEPYEGIGRGPLNIEHLPVFSDTQGPFGAPMSDSERTKVTDLTGEVLSIIIAFEKDVPMQDLLDKATMVFGTVCGGEVIEQSILTNQ